MDRIYYNIEMNTIHLADEFGYNAYPLIYFGWMNQYDLEDFFKFISLLNDPKSLECLTEAVVWNLELTKKNV